MMNANIPCQLFRLCCSSNALHGNVGRLKLLCYEYVEHRLVP